MLSWESPIIMKQCYKNVNAGTQELKVSSLHYKVEGQVVEGKAQDRELPASEELRAESKQQQGADKGISVQKDLSCCSIWGRF